MMPVVLICIVALAALGIAGAALAKKPAGRFIVYGGCILIDLLSIVAGLIAIFEPVQRLALPLGIPWIGVHLRLDALSGFFLIILGLGSGGASLFAIGYTQHDEEPQRVLPFYPLFLAAMHLVLIADDAFVFLFAWEVMSLSSWALVMATHKEKATAQAGFVYLIMAVFSGLALLLAFGTLAGATGGYGFDAMRLAHPTAGLAALIFLLTLVGAGSKAGLVPLHVWLPLAHPAAPSHVSALMSGVMTKIALYGFIRIVFDLLGGAPWWAATLVLVLGGITAVLGVLHALMERDLKRLLAYSTVENIGIVFVGLGLALAFRANGFPAGAALALVAALFHAFNHTLFKSLLFFGAGSVLHVTGTRDIEKLGGLIKRMPVTSAAMLAGCVAISALPPMNGFASEWLTFQAILLRPELPQWGLKLAIPADGALLALAAALAAACFVRAFGIAFLGRPRSDAATQAHETDRWCQAAMVIFGGLCLLTGLFPGVVIDLLAPVAQALVGARMPDQLHNAWLTTVPIAYGRSSYNALLLFVFVGASGWIAALAVKRFGSRGLRRAPAWDCGFPDPSPMTQYTSASLGQPIKRVYGAMAFGARDTLDMPAPGDMRAASLTSVRSDYLWAGMYVPLGRLVTAISTYLNVLQFLTIRRYLGFVFLALIVLLAALALWQ
jgi:hydrogenase-4 component B